MPGERVVRAATLADVEAITVIYAPMVTDTFMSFEESPPDSAEITRRMLANPRLPWRLINEVRDLGYMSLFAGIALPNDPSVMLHETIGHRGRFVNRHT